MNPTLMPGSQPNDELTSVVRTLNRFANAFDTKEWASLEDCLAPSLHADYSQLRGTPAETMTAGRFVELRRQALDHLVTQHLFANHEVDVHGTRASAKVSAAIFRRHADGRTLHTHCLYHFELARAESGWKIHAIRQQVYWSEGDRSLHAGIEQSPTSAAAGS
jgi:hypothetical protein